MKSTFGLPAAAAAVTLVCSCGGNAVMHEEVDSNHAGGGGNSGTDSHGRGGNTASQGGDRDGHPGGSGGAGGAGLKNSGGTVPNGGIGSGSDGGDGGAVSSNMGGTSGKGGSGNNAGNGGDGSTALPMDLRTKPTVWIGQTESTVTLPEVLDQRKSTEPQKLVLILAPIVNDQSVNGKLTFGDEAPPPVPTSLDEPYPPRDTDFRRNWISLPYAGFEYSVAWSVLSQNHLTLAYVPSELFRDWCPLSPPGQPMTGCECSETECHSAKEPINRIDLIVDGDSMGGQLSATSTDPSALIEVRLKRVN